MYVYECIHTCIYMCVFRLLNLQLIFPCSKIIISLYFYIMFCNPALFIAYYVCSINLQSSYDTILPLKNTDVLLPRVVNL